MKQIKTMLIAILLTLAANADWKPIKSLDHYGSKAFTLKKDVSYVEIRVANESGDRRPGIEMSTRVSTVLSIYKKPLSAYGAKIEKKFKQIPVKEKYAFNKGSFVGMVSMSSWYYNGFMLDSAGKSWRLENVRDVIDMVKPIDTPAELRLVLWLDPKIYAGDVDKYRKSGNSYIVKSHYVIHDASSGEGCGDYTYQYKVSRSGKITQKKLLRKKAVEDCGSE